jgi:lysophospholipase L1-like esterase
MSKPEVSNDQPHKARQKAKTVLFSLIPLLLLFSAVELAARAYKSARPPYWNMADRLTNPAYTSKPWFSESFLIAACLNPGGWYTPPGTRVIFPRDYRDDYFTVEGGLRKTTGFPEGTGRPFRTLFALGGSTTYCAETPDNFTWPSRFQLLLTEENPAGPIKTLNLGVTSVNSSQEYARLVYEIQRGNVPEICVIFNGVNDCYQGVLYNNPEGTLYEEASSMERSLLRRLKRKLAVLDLTAEFVYARRRTGRLSAHEASLGALATRTAALYEEHMRAAQKLCDEHGILMCVCLQPNLFTIGRRLNEHENGIRERRLGVYPQLERCFQETYPLLRERVASMHDSGIHAWDLSGVFDANTEPIFLDECHVESEGNRIIAEEIFKRIQFIIK